MNRVHAVPKRLSELGFASEAPGLSERVATMLACAATATLAGSTSCGAPRCSHRLRVVATLTERAVVTKNLDPSQVRKAPLPRAPTWVQERFEYEHAVA